MKTNKQNKLDKYPEEYQIIFNQVENANAEDSTKENEEINELRKAVLNINEPQYTFTTSTSCAPPFILSYSVK